MPESIAKNGVLWPETPSQTAGPFVHIGLALAVAGLPPRVDEIDNRLATEDAEGEPIEIRGLVIDGNGQPVEDVLVEAWQADAQGVYRTDFRIDNAFKGFGRAAPSQEERGEWRLQTIKPGRVDHPDGRPMAPHINLMLFARGINIHLHTRLYFDDEDASNKDCPFLARVPGWRRNTLVATHESDSDIATYRFVIRLQGADETVFFDF